MQGVVRRWAGQGVFYRREAAAGQQRSRELAGRRRRLVPADQARSLPNMEGVLISVRGFGNGTSYHCTTIINRQAGRALLWMVGSFAVVHAVVHAALIHRDRGACVLLAHHHLLADQPWRALRQQHLVLRRHGQAVPRLHRLVPGNQRLQRARVRLLAVQRLPGSQQPRLQHRRRGVDQRRHSLHAGHAQQHVAARHAAHAQPSGQPRAESSAGAAAYVAPPGALERLQWQPYTTQTASLQPGRGHYHMHASKAGR